MRRMRKVERNSKEQNEDGEMSISCKLNCCKNTNRFSVLASLTCVNQDWETITVCFVFFTFTMDKCCKFEALIESDLFHRDQAENENTVSHVSLI